MRYFLIIISQMNNFISQIPQLPQFLSTIPSTHHQETIKQLIMIGLNVIKSSMKKEVCCHKSKPHHDGNLVGEIQSIKQNLEELNRFIGLQKCRQGCFNKQTPIIQQDFQIPTKQNNTAKCQQIENNFSFNPVRQSIIHVEYPDRQKEDITLKVTQTKPSFQVCRIPRKKAYSRHHLDDAQVRAALHFPSSSYRETHHHNNKSQDYKKHTYQQEVNKEQQQRLKQNVDVSQSRKKTKTLIEVDNNQTNNKFKKTKSKIKSLVVQDRLRHQQKQHQRSYKEGFNKYEYSDENQMEDEEPQPSQPQNHETYMIHNTYDEQFHPSSNPSSQKQSSYKQFSRSKNQVSSNYQPRSDKYQQSEEKFSSQHQQSQYERSSEKINEEHKIEYEDDNVVSNSSSFSQFSMSNSSRREVGKISRRKAD